VVLGVAPVIGDHRGRTSSWCGAMPQATSGRTVPDAYVGRR
jgi:hypothetical protein